MEAFHQQGTVVDYAAVPSENFVVIDSIEFSGGRL